MSLKAGIVGLPNVGKSTLFNAITNSNVEAANYPFATIKPNSGIVEVNDPRVDFLVSIFSPKRVVKATCEFTDIAGLVKGASKGEGLGNQFLGNIRNCDAICHVVRCFDNPDIIHVDNTVDPQRDIETINLELIFSDLDVITKRIVKVETKARTTKEKDVVIEYNLLNKVKNALENEKPARSLSYTDEELLILSNFNLLTMKPVVYVANVTEDDYADPSASKYYQTVVDIAKKENAEVIAISANIEEELSKLPQQDKIEYLNALGVNATGLDRLVNTTYHLLNLSTFFTVGSDEVRAWNFTKGMTAPQCAGTIHTDFERGFICAEVYAYQDIEEYKSEKALKEAGKIRMEGKSYKVQDGDCLLIKFNV
ncbi:MAG: redox-regulated ATPase YchF [Bacillales bacterium]|nr:redox-regulated ATPase YchF [Bacillales bacterium]